MQIYTKGVISYCVESFENVFGFYVINITKLIEICQSILFIAWKHEIDYDLDFIFFLRFVFSIHFSNFWFLCQMKILLFALSILLSFFSVLYALFLKIIISNEVNCKTLLLFFL